ncbi:zinc/manganese transport system ATP-binding protein [Silvimonas terrae]|uniref:Zinc/manganese transport system ATP-binding protein n=1 Tax=Silvimonas terrae TaxID=300266 RepID=A0A840RHK6_9NEIS|nr:ABC transporter ATP-binding protein [Silvimonas terrae]MBB5192567.1 zinc/manganese transport system ATP-binding protein [Silvimonas terrae]
MIRLDDITVCYRKHPAVHHVSGTFTAGGLTAVVGPNGAGKTTLLKAITGLQPLTTGKIVADGAIAYLPQLAELDRQFPLTVSELVLSGAWQRKGGFASLAGDEATRTQSALDRVGLSGFGERPISTLSGGQLQRARFARLLVQDTPIILLDEPFNNIDTRTRDTLLHILEHWRDESRTVAVVVHDMGIAHSHFPETLLLAHEVIAWGPTAATLDPANLDRAQQMTEYWQNDAPWCARP